MTKKLIISCFVLAVMVSTAWGWSGTFINANTDNTRRYDDSNDWWNTAGWDGTPHWRYRTPYGAPEGFDPGDCNTVVPDGDIYQSIDSGESGTDAYTLKTTITDLDDSETYAISVFFWIDEHDSPWRIRAALTQGDLWKNQYLFVGGTGGSPGQSTPICVGQDGAGRIMYRAFLGLVTGVTEQVVWIDDMPTDNSNLRTWYDGVGYVPEPATIALLGLGGLALLRRKRA